MNRYTDIIDSYFSGAMNAGEIREFERQLQMDPELKAEFDQQLEIMQGMERVALKGEMFLGFKRQERRVKTYRWLSGIAAAVLLVTIVVTQWPDDAPTAEETKAEPPAPVVSAPEAPVAKAEIRHDAAPVAIKNEQLSQAAKDLSQHKEAQPGKLSVWSTKAKGQALPPNSAAEPLALSQSRTQETKAPSAGKTVFGRSRQADGSMDWSNLGGLGKSGAIVDSTGLNYFWYSQDSMKDAGFSAKNKRLADSLYRSFRQSAAGKEYFGNDTNSTVLLAIVERPARLNGAALFRKNCASCHNLNTQKLEGPGLQGVMSRVPGKDWLYNYILNSRKVIAGGDSYANKIYEAHGKKNMKVFEGILSGPEVRSIIDYLGTLPAADAPRETK